MKLTKTARAKLKLMTQAEKSAVKKATKTLLDASLLGPKQALLISRNYS